MAKRTKRYTDEQAAEMLDTDVREIRKLGKELGVDADDWTHDAIADADELLDDGEQDEARKPLGAAATKALERARKLVALAVDGEATDNEARTAALQACKLIAKHELLDGKPVGDLGSDDVAGDVVGDMIDSVAGAVAEGIRRAARRAKKEARR